MSDTHSWWYSRENKAAIAKRAEVELTTWTPDSIRSETRRGYLAPVRSPFEVVGVLDSADVLSDNWPPPIYCTYCGGRVRYDEHQIEHPATKRRWHDACWMGLARADESISPAQEILL